MIKFKRLRENATIPHYATDGSAGLDLTYAPDDDRPIALNPGERFAFETGLACAIPYGHCGVIMPRSGLAVNFGLDKLAGLIDADYRGEIKVVLVNHGTKIVLLSPGERIAQLVILPVYTTNVIETDTLPDTDRGEGGFGSTGL